MDFLFHSKKSHIELQHLYDVKETRTIHTLFPEDPQNEQIQTNDNTPRNNSFYILKINDL